ncbi:TetR family transcriptional regulator [Glutamicibacter sp. JC586]|uniref:TetR family transcriptional regulator n=1 Tax=Glutamicibacter sp. JC586 TaxID=2590552 RepID=UPI00135ABB2C|nr:TetR family transcriptional regulator [Glutamicibacter sp. JC586]
MGIRDERKAETSRKIQAAALDLVEEFGLEATTVSRIAQQVGISDRTFFRYFDSKESAIVPGQSELVTALTGLELAAGATPASIFQALLQVCRDHFSAEIEQHEFRRVTRLMVSVPKLLLIATSREQELVVELSRSLVDRGLVTQMQALLIAEMVASSWRVAWQCFTQAERSGTSAVPSEFFEQAVKEMVQISSTGLALS